MKITRCLRDGSFRFKPGDEAALDAYLTPEQGAVLLATGAITGDGWRFGVTQEPKPEPKKSPRRKR